MLRFIHHKFNKYMPHVCIEVEVALFKSTLMEMTSINEIS